MAATKDRANGSTPDNQFAQHAAAVARELYGEPNKRMSQGDELRFGSNGSLSVDVKMGTFYNFEHEEGGGVLDMIQQAKGFEEKTQAIDWLKEHGFYVEDRPAPTPAAAPAQQRANPRVDSKGNWLPPNLPANAEQTAAYNYTDPDGKTVYQVVRFEWPDDTNPKGHGKEFRQRKPSTTRRDGWDWQVKGLTPLPYRLPEVLAAIHAGETIFVVEGEKKADALAALGVTATCNSGGAGKFSDALLQYFHGAKIITLADNDPAGRDHVQLVGNKLKGIAAEVRHADLPGLPPKGDVIDWLAVGGTVDALYDIAERARPHEETPYQSRFRAVLFRDLDKPAPRHEWLVKLLLTTSEVSMLAGPSQSGKTFVALDIALSIARGIDWMGRKTRKGAVVYIAAESAVGVRQKRLKAYRQHYGLEHEDLPFVLLQSPLDLYHDDEQTDQLIEEINYWARALGVKLALVVIDTLAAVTPGWDENSSKDVGPVLARCARIRDATQAHVMLVHHMNAEGAKPRGHTSMFANVENVLICKRIDGRLDDDHRRIHELTVAKQKEGEDGTRVRFVLPAIEIGIDADGDAETSCIVRTPAGGTHDPSDERGVILSGKPLLIYKIICAAIAEIGQSPPPGTTAIPQSALVVDRKIVTERIAKIDLDDEPEPETDAERAKRAEAKRKAVARARETLIAKDLIGIDDPWIWVKPKRVQGQPMPVGAPFGVDRKSEIGSAPAPFAEEEGDA